MATSTAPTSVSATRSRWVAKAAALAGAVGVVAAVVVGVALRGARSTVPVTGLVDVTVRSYQALPPPYEPGYVVLKPGPALSAFTAVLRSDHIGTTSQATSSGGCSGGTQYNVTLTYRAGPKRGLDAYSCAGSVTGNLTGKVASFVNYLAALGPPS